MKKSIAGILIALVLAMPFAFADVQAEAKSVSVLDLKIRQMGEAFSDFAFKVKSALAFDNEAKLELIKERNADLKARQATWVDVKQDAMASFNSNMTSRQKHNILAVLQAEHEAIIEDSLELNEEIREIQLDAKAENNVELEAKAKAASESTENGLLGIFIDLDLGTEFENDAELDIKVESETEAKAVVKSKLGLEGDEVKTVVKSSTTFYVVSGQDTETVNGFSMTKNFFVWVEASSGMIMAVDMDMHIESTAQVNASKTVSKPKGLLEIEISSGTNADANSKSGSPSSGAGTKSSASVSAGASGGASSSGASAEASSSVQVSVN